MAGNYVFSLTLPANTPETAPVEQEVLLSPGIIEKISIGFPPGCKALAHVQIKQNESVVYPSNPDSSYAWDDTIYTFSPIYALEENLSVLTLVGWNEDSVFLHEITVIINVIESVPIMMSIQGVLTSFGVL